VLAESSAVKIGEILYKHRIIAPSGSKSLSAKRLVGETSVLHLVHAISVMWTCY